MLRGSALSVVGADEIVCAYYTQTTPSTQGFSVASFQLPDATPSTEGFTVASGTTERGRTVPQRQQEVLHPRQVTSAPITYRAIAPAFKAVISGSV